MSEAGFFLFESIYSVAAEVLYAVYLTLFFRSFPSRQRRAPWLVFVIYCTVSLLCDALPAPRGVCGLLVTAALTAVAGLLGLERAAAFLLMILYWNARIASGLIVESIYFIIERLLPPSPESLEAIYLRATWLVTLFLVCHAALLAVMLWLLGQRLKKRPMRLSRREVCYLCLVPSAGILFGQMISRLLIEFEDGVLLELYGRHPAFLGVVPLLAALFFAGTYLTIAFQQGLTALQEEQATYYIERQQTQAIRARIQEAERFYARIRQLQHEMRGHLTSIKGLAHSGAYDALEEYLSRMNESMRDPVLTLSTGNPVTDVIVSDYRQLCGERGVRFEVDFHYPASGGCDAFDVGIILQNLLQNALEACERVPEGEQIIALAGRRRGRFFLIEVKNPYVGEVVFGVDGLPVTSKQNDASLHGIGLANVRREAEKYLGELELKTQANEFCATVLLQERSTL